MLDQAFQALKTYDWGQDRNQLKPIDDAVVKSHGDAAARKSLEKRLAEALASDLGYDSKQFLCRKLMQVGGAACVPALAALLGDEQLSHMARYALERIPASEAAAALRNAAGKLNGQLRIGVISSLGARQDEAAAPMLGELLVSSDPAVAKAAAYALGAIRSAKAAAFLRDSKASTAASGAVADASLACAEALLASGEKAQAAEIYDGLSKSDQPRHVKLAAARGRLASRN